MTSRSARARSLGGPLHCSVVTKWIRFDSSRCAVADFLGAVAFARG